MMMSLAFTTPAQTRKVKTGMENESHWMDNVSLVFSLIVIGLAGAWMVHSGAFDTGIIASDKLSWYLTRASGITAYIMLTLSVIWGLALTSSAIKDWSPGPLSMMIHATISWLGLLFGMVHGLMLLFDNYFTYRITNILIPFNGPYRPFAVGLGILTFWIMIVVTPSFALKKRLFSYHTWKKLHYMSYTAFILATAHGMTAGTDASKPGFQVMFGGSVLVTLILLGYRIGVKKASHGKSSQARSPRTAARVTSGETP